MRKIIIAFVIIIICGVCYLFITEITYSPLNPQELKMLFPNDSGSIAKINSKDFIGFNMRGDIYDVYLYKVNSVYIDSTFPRIMNNWENEKISSQSLISTWKNCPIDSIGKELYRFDDTDINFQTWKYNDLFQKEISNKENYYSYIYLTEQHKYFLFYNPTKKLLYYIRLKGL